MNNNSRALLHISLIKGIGPVTVYTLYTQLPSFFDIYHKTVTDIMHLGIARSKAQTIVQGLQDDTALKEEIDLCQKHNISIVTLADEDYPEILRDITYPPPVLWWKGKTLSGFEKSIAVVGSRNAHAYAHKSIEMLISPLAADGYAIVSGGAVGADTYAHNIALEAGALTYSVLGSGLLKPYPDINKKLFDKIEQNGALISVFPVQTQPLQGNFPARNRIIAGLSLGCLVVQAAQKSGALITAKYALDYGREVFAVPGLIHDPLHVGCHNLIRQGAHIAVQASDIADVFGFSRMPTRALKNEQDHPLLIYASTPVSVQELSEYSGLPLDEVQNQLFSLLIEGRIEQTPMGSWKRV